MKTNVVPFILYAVWWSAVIVDCFAPIGRPRSTEQHNEITRHGLRDSFLGTMGRLFYPEQRRKSLKKEILCLSWQDIELSATNNNRSVATLVKDMGNVSPISHPSRAPELFQTWNLTWTTDPDMQQMYQYKTVLQTLMPGKWKWEFKQDLEGNKNSRKVIPAVEGGQNSLGAIVWGFLQMDGMTYAMFQGELEAASRRRMIFCAGRTKLVSIETVYLDESLRIDVGQEDNYIYVFQSLNNGSS